MLRPALVSALMHFESANKLLLIWVPSSMVLLLPSSVTPLSAPDKSTKLILLGTIRFAKSGSLLSMFFGWERMFNCRIVCERDDLSFARVLVVLFLALHNFSKVKN